MPGANVPPALTCVLPTVPSPVSTPPFTVTGPATPPERTVMVPPLTVAVPIVPASFSAPPFTTAGPSTNPPESTFMVPPLTVAEPIVPLPAIDSTPFCTVNDASDMVVATFSVPCCTVQGIAVALKPVSVQVESSTLAKELKPRYRAAGPIVLMLNVPVPGPPSCSRSEPVPTALPSHVAVGAIVNVLPVPAN